LLFIVNGNLVERPKDMKVVMGETIILHCRTNLSTEVQWKHTSIGNDTTTVYWETTITKIYSDTLRFIITSSNEGWLNITIKNVTYIDAGKFMCEEEEEGENSSMELTIVGKQIDQTVHPLLTCELL